MDSLRIVLLILGVAVIAGIYFWETRTSRRRRTDVEDDLDTTYLDELGGSRGRKDFGYTRTGDLPSLGDASQIIEGQDHLAPDLPRMGGEFDAITNESEVIEPESEVDTANTGGVEAAVESPDQLSMDLRSADELVIESINAIAPIARRPSDAELSPEDELVIAVTLMCKNREPLSGEEIVRELSRLGFAHGDMNLFHHFGIGRADQHEPIFSIASVVNPGSFDLDEVADISTPGLALFARLTTQDSCIPVFEALLDVARSLADQFNVELCDQNRNPLSKQLINHLREEIVEFTRRTRIKV